mmetsp:Transcript_45536/g.102835  ORF Transcript_45536/g.102835 Transcript_45536/m.102835 type:complete len:435 (+) Transcript_45536:79-1383(+)
MFRMLTLASIAVLVTPASAFMPSRLSTRLSTRSVLMAADGEEFTSAGLRTVKLMLPGDSVARKRRRVEDEELDELQAPADENALLAERSTQAMTQTDEGFAGSTSKFGGALTDAFKDNFWLGTVAPAVAVVWGGRKVIKIRTDKFETRQKGLINSYANEMMLKDGDVKALQRVHGDYVREVAKSKRDEMVLEFMKRFFSKQAVSGDAVKSLALFISLHNLDDTKAAGLLLKLGEEFGAKKPVAVGKVLLLAERVLKDTAAVELLQPLKDDITAKTYGSDPEVAAKLFKASQNMLIEAALRQVAENLPEDLETMDDARDLIKAEARLLGVTDEKAMAILDQLLTEARIEEEMGDVDEEESGDVMAALMASTEGQAEEGGAPVNTGNGPLIVDCKCGYVLFVAKGREEKFFGANFEGCPECGAPKADMTPRAPKEE